MHPSVFGNLMDRLETMSIFVAAVEEGSLSAAARQLGIPLTTVSRSVSDLEAHLKTRLLHRSSRKLILTDAGRSYVTACKQILEYVREAERGASGEYSAPRGNLNITAPIVFGRLHIVPIVAEFLRAYPDIDIRMMLADGVANLLEERTDLAIRIAALPDSSLLASRVGSIRRVVCGSPAYFAERGIPTEPNDVSTHDCITRDGQSFENSWTFNAGKSSIAIPIHARFIVNTAEAAIDAAIAGTGVTRVLSYQIVDAVRSGQLVPVLENFEPEPMPVSLVYAAQGLLPLKLRAFIDFATPRLKAKFPSLALQ
jgi:DNA-binding transcriptional LysR family regulator